MSTPAAARKSRNFYRGISKELRQLVTRCEKAGGEVQITGSGHLTWICPDGFEFPSSCTTSSAREPKRVRAKLRKHGVAC